MKCQNNQNSLPVERQMQRLFFVIISKDIFLNIWILFYHYVQTKRIKLCAMGRFVN